MIKLDLNKKLINIDRKQVDEKTVGMCLGEFVGLKKIVGIGPVRAMNLSFDLYQNKPIEIDKSEFNGIKSSIEVSEDLSMLLVGQIVEALLDQYEKHKNETQKVQT